MDLVGSLALVGVVALIGFGVSAVLRASAEEPLSAGAQARLPLLALLGAALGAFGGSEWFGILSDWGPTIDGLNILPAIVGGAAIGTLAGLSALAPAQELHA